MEIEQYIDLCLQNEGRRLEFVRSGLKGCPDGELYEGKRGARPYYVESYFENGKRIRKGVSQKPEIIKGLIRRYLYEKEIEVLESRSKVLSICRNALIDFSQAEKVRMVKEKWPNVADELIHEAITQDDVSAWSAGDYKQSDYLPEQRNQITSFGLRVRSKSELFIAEKLHDHGIAFRYEQELVIQGNKLIPDFCIMRADGKKYVWEHEGLTNDEKYLDKQLYKEKLYSTIGIVRWNNLIVTYDDENGNIDLRIVESEIRNKLIV